MHIVTESAIPYWVYIPEQLDPRHHLKFQANLLTGHQFGHHHNLMARAM